MASSGQAATDEATSDKLPDGVSSVGGTRELQPISGSISVSENHQEGNIPSITPEKASVEPDQGAVHSEGHVPPSKSKKEPKTPDRTAHAVQSDTEGISPVIREKGSEDGYNWRKYGQKLVRGNEFIRSYYKCTHPKCLVKKQLERSHDGRITDTVYFGQHDHPKPNSTPVAVGFVVSIIEERQNIASSVAKEKSSDAHGDTPHQTGPVGNLQVPAVASKDDVKDVLLGSNRVGDEPDTSDDPGLKRRKKDNYNMEIISVEKQSSEPRIVVQTRSEVDIVNDGYRWRKYGQKLVKGNPHPRSYYRCSSPGCRVKKHVERTSHDPKLLTTTYEGHHDHDKPPARTVTHNTAGSDVHKIPSNKESGSSVESGNKSKDSGTGCRITPHPEKFDEQHQTPNAEPIQS